MQNFSLFDESFSKDLISSYSLFMQLSYNSFTYCIYDDFGSKFLAIKHYDFHKDMNDNSLGKKINEVLISEDIFCSAFKQSKIIFVNPKSTFVPSSLFDIGKINELFSFNFGMSGNEKIMFYHIYDNDFYILFSIPGYIKQIFEEWFPEIKFYNQSCPFIQQQLKFNKNNDQMKIYAEIHGNFIDILVIRSYNLLFYNTFHYNDDNDLLYFILNVYDKLKLNPEDAGITLSGLIEKDSPGYRKLNDYIKKISFNVQHDNINFSYKFRDLTQHIFINLINLAKCE